MNESSSIVMERRGVLRRKNNKVLQICKTTGYIQRTIISPLWLECVWHGDTRRKAREIRQNASGEGPSTMEFGFYYEGSWKPSKEIKQMCDIKFVYQKDYFLAVMKDGLETEAIQGQLQKSR